MTLKQLVRAALVTVLCLCAGLAPTPDPDRVYRLLRAAYADGDAAAAAAAYHPEAVYEEVYPGHPTTIRQGRAAIEAGFKQLFAALAPMPGEHPLDLEFRLIKRSSRTGVTVDEGLFRLRHGPGEGARRPTLYGRFETRHAHGGFLLDRSSPADEAVFETAGGPVLLDPASELLAPVFHDRLLGTYRAPDGHTIRITRSQRTLFAYDPAKGTLRALSRENGLLWHAGQHVLDPHGRKTRYSFEPQQDAVTVDTAGASAVLYRRVPGPVREEISFQSGEQTLAGTVLLPAELNARAPGIVLVHGSGPQDRHGYASIIELLAGEFVEAGFVVLTYDKRGVGGSQGDWTRAGFPTLAADAAAALAVLSRHPRVDARRLGLGGSSQAGWVIAAAIDQGAQPASVFLLGAAGAAMTVMEQNLYNTGVQMRCSGLGAADIALALDQQRAFFEARRRPDQQSRAALAAISARAQAIPAIRPWLFPASPDPGPRSEWYDVLDPDFDPLPVWAGYRSPALFLFGANDDATDATLAAARLAAGPSDRLRVVEVVPGAQHLGLASTGPCDSLETLDRFHPAILGALRRWARQVAAQ